MDLYDKDIDKKMNAFDEVIDEYWTAITNPKNSGNKRRRDGHICNSEECEDGYRGRFVEILKCHKKTLTSKHELYLLPLLD